MKSCLPSLTRTTEPGEMTARRFDHLLLAETHASSDFSGQIVSQPIGGYEDLRTTDCVDQYFSDRRRSI
ncbi:hypothetical protein [Paracoccus alcaliphilus]|nr:hypothetical protein [Paracoccus alcaliphilus]